MKQEMQKAIEDLGVTVDAVFVPFSQSKNAKPAPRTSNLSLNWKVTIKVKGRDILTTNYSAGIAHCPSYHRGRLSMDDDEAIRWECERGKQYRKLATLNIVSAGGKFILPDTADVVWSLTSDASALDHSSFEAWAEDFGYDADSRKAEAIYRECLDIAIKLRNAVGEAGFKMLQDAAQDY